MTSKICVRCGIKGHTCKVCYGPITSFGVIVFGKKENINTPLGEMYSDTYEYSCNYNHENEKKKYSIYKNKTGPNDDIYFLLVERKDSISFIGLVQGVYSNDEKTRDNQIKQYTSNLTCQERYQIEHSSWNELWDIAGSNKKNKFALEKRFNNIKNLLSIFLNDSKCQYKQADYLMPKGRLKFKETTREGAIREFSEETGYKKDDITLLDIPPFEEVFVGINGNTYKNVFYVAEIKSNSTIDVPLNKIKEQSKEVRNVGWFNLNESLDKVRSNGKQRILYNSYNAIKEHCF
jgi:8-oxo-dGTP pyrophosphatase MutT (NUDIX family)